MARAASPSVAASSPPTILPARARSGYSQSDKAGEEDSTPVSPNQRQSGTLPPHPAFQEWAYIRPWSSETERHDAYAGFIHFYNHHRSHGSLKWATPISILEDNLPKVHT